MKVINTKFDHSDTYKTSRVDIRLDDGNELSVFVDEDGTVSLCATNPPKHAPLTYNEGHLVKIDHYGYPSD